MEPEDLPLHDLLDTNQPAGPEDLRAIVTKANRHRVRFAVIAAGVALAVGGGAGGAIGYASSNHPGHAVQTASSPESSSSNSSSSSSGGGTASGGSAGPAIVSPGVSSVRLTHEFTRTANGVEIRGYEIPTPAASAGFPRCDALSTPRFQAEVSTDKAVGVVTGFYLFGTTGSVGPMIDDAVIGIGEGAPVGVVVAATSSSVTDVKVTFKGGATDEMAPVAGWVALAGPIPVGDVKAKSDLVTVGTVTAYNAAGTKVFSQSVSYGGASFGSALRYLPGSVPCTACGTPVMVPAQPGPSASTGTAPVRPPTIDNPPATASPSVAPACPVIQGGAGSGGSGSAKTGTAGSGTASSGAATNG